MHDDDVVVARRTGAQHRPGAGRAVLGHVLPQAGDHFRNHVRASRCRGRCPLQHANPAKRLKDRAVIIVYGFGCERGGLGRRPHTFRADRRESSRARDSSPTAGGVFNSRAEVSRCGGECPRSAHVKAKWLPVSSASAAISLRAAGSSGHGFGQERISSTRPIGLK